MTMEKNNAWKRVKWQGNDAEPYASWECWEKQCNGYTVVLYPGQWPTEGWSFCVTKPESVAYSGFLPGFIDIAAAKAELERRDKINEIIYPSRCVQGLFHFG